LSATLKDKYETTSKQPQLIVDKSGVQSSYETVDTYGAKAFVYTISNQKEVDKNIGANTISVVNNPLSD